MSQSVPRAVGFFPAGLHPAFWFSLCACMALGASGDKRDNEKRGSQSPVQTSNCNAVPAHPFDLILCRPTHESVTLSVLTYHETEGSVAYGTQPGCYTWQSPMQIFKKGEPIELVLGSLQPNTQYFYQFRCSGTNSAPASFHTQRPPGATFTFTITADSHLDEHTRSEVYMRTLANARADAPDFHVDLGDTFMTEKHESQDNAFKQYLDQRYYFGSLNDAVPLFLVLGNHDGESPRGRGSDSDSLSVWSNMMRERYFPNPVPNNFYTGNAAKHAEAGLLQNYYAWKWGDALFVVLDPFWYTQKQRGQRDNWKRSLGIEQYQWLKSSLETSRAKFKFVFIHHLVGGATPEGRGGAEAAPFYEWGGKNPDGTDGFKLNRPGWSTPIHCLLVQNHVSAVFHGHDHLYAKQDMDGIVYQECPQPGDPKGSTRSAAEYSYKSGTILGSSGHMRITVSAAKVTVDYVRAALPQDETAERKNRQVVHSYTINPSGSNVVSAQGTTP